MSLGFRIVYDLVYFLLIIYVWLILARAILTWLPIRVHGWLYEVQRVLFLLTEPYLKLFRRIIPIARVGGVGIDLSLFVGLIVLYVLYLAMQVLYRF